MLHILIGEDDYSISQALKKIQKSIGDESLLAANITTLDGMQLTLNQLKSFSEALPFFAEKRLVIISGLMKRFESKRKSTHKKSKHQSDQQNEYQLFAEYICRMPDSTILVLTDGKIKNNNPLLKECNRAAEVRIFPLLKEFKLRQWIKQHVVEAGGSISLHAETLLTRLVGSNLWIMANELDKLVLFTAGRCIEEEDIRKVVSYTQQFSVFALIDAILAFKSDIAEQVLQQHLQVGAAPSYLLVMLARQVQMIVRVKDMRKQHKSQINIQENLGLISGYALKKTMDQADKYTMERLREVYRRLLETDLSIKTGKYDSELALSILVAEICQMRSVRIN